jgi:signal transduction histidine kinase
MADNPQSSHQRSPGSRRAVLGALAAELGHDLQGPANLFRLTIERVRAGASLDAEDLLMLDEELTRLSQISSRLRTLAQSPLHRARCCPQDVMQAALGRADSARSLALDLDLDSGQAYQLHCDQQLLSLALAELLDNAATAKSERAGLRFAATGKSGFCVWDDGAGFAVDSAKALGWGVTTKPGAAGLGLTLALRAARAHGYDLEITRQGALTEVWLLIPAREIENRPSKLPG